MVADKIPSDSTIESVWTRLTHPRKYVSGVLAAMRKYRDEGGNISVRIGITGSGQKPYYRVFRQVDDGDDVIFGSYYDNHEPLENGFAQTFNWSVNATSFEDLENFYANQIGYTGKRPR